MQLPGMLIEYLINGSCALIWIWISLRMLGMEVPSVSDARLVLFLPAIYVIGMIIDYVARGLVLFVVDTTKGLKRTAKSRKATVSSNNSETDKIGEKRKPKKGSVSRAYMFLHSPELSKQYEMRSSRDRVARGAFLNTILLTISLIIFCPCSNPYLPLNITLPAGLFLSGLCFAMWYRFERLTSRFKQSAYKAILKKGIVS